MGKKKEKLIMEKQFDDLIKQMKKLKKKVSKKMEEDYLEYKESDPTVDFKKEIKDLEDTVSKYTQAINDSDNQIEKLQKEIIKLKKENESLTEKNKKLKEFKKQVESDSSDDRKETVGEPNKDLINLYEKKLDARNTELNETRCKLTEAYDEINSLKAQISNANIIIEKLQKKSNEKDVNDDDISILVNTLNYLLSVIVILDSHMSNGGFNKMSEMNMKIPSIQVYKGSKKLFEKFDSFYFDLCDETNEIKRILETALAVVGVKNKDIPHGCNMVNGIELDEFSVDESLDHTVDSFQFSRKSEDFCKQKHFIIKSPVSNKYEEVEN